MSEKKLVEAFKTFFDKSIHPYVSTNEPVMTQWRYFSKLISSQPIDYSQLEFYSLLARSQNSPVPSIPDYRNTSYGESHKHSQHTPNHRISNEDSEKKSASSKMITSPRKEQPGSRRGLVACLEGFQGLLLRNQEKLESMCRRDVGTAPTGANLQPRRFY